MARRPVREVSYPTDTVFAAACAAQRVNGAYLKEDVIAAPVDGVDSPVVKIANKKLIHNFLQGIDPITEADQYLAQRVRSHFQGLTFKILQGQHLSAFDSTALNIAQSDTVNGYYSLAVAASLPSCYERAMDRLKVDTQIRQAAGGYLGNCGEKVSSIKIRILKSFYSIKWNINYVTGISETDQVVLFTYREKLLIDSDITIKGTIKAHREDQVTQLSRVKVL